MLSNPQSFEAIAAVIRELASGPVALQIMVHAKRQMKAREIRLQDATYVLKGCRVKSQDFEKGEWVYNAEGRDRDGMRIVFAVVPYEEENKIKIVSAWKSRTN